MAGESYCLSWRRNILQRVLEKFLVICFKRSIMIIVAVLLAPKSPYDNNTRYIIYFAPGKFDDFIVFERNLEP